MRLRVSLTPANLAAETTGGGWPGDRRHWTGVAIDVLRATTSLSVALDHGAARVVPCVSPEAALALRSSEAGVLACGEREGRMIPGFDLGNSPFEYDRARVSGRTLAFASTNGSLAMAALANCGARLLGSFVNAAALIDHLAGCPFTVLVCAGKLGKFSLEDAACAGWLCAALEHRGARLEGSGARLAHTLAPADADGVRSLTEGTSHGRELRRMGADYTRDVEYCGSLDVLRSVAAW
jgi:2-phosphosulfolactate phosphatase